MKALLAFEALLLAVSLYLVFSPRTGRVIYRDPRLTGGFGVAMSMVLLVLTIHSLNAGRQAVRALASVIDLYPKSSFTTVPPLAEVRGFSAFADAFRGDSAAARRELQAARQAALHPEPRMWIAEVQDSVPVVVRFYRAATERGGWTPQPAETLESQDLVSLVYVRGEQKLSISVSSEWTCTRIFYTLEPAPPPP